MNVASIVIESILAGAKRLGLNTSLTGNSDADPNGNVKIEH